MLIYFIPTLTCWYFSQDRKISVSKWGKRKNGRKNSKRKRKRRQRYGKLRAKSHYRCQLWEVKKKGKLRIENFPSSHKPNQHHCHPNRKSKMIKLSTLTWYSWIELWLSLYSIWMTRNGTFVEVPHNRSVGINLNVVTVSFFKHW